MTRAHLLFSLAASVLAAGCSEEECSQTQPCVGGKSCVNGACVSKGISPGDSCRATGTCGPDQLCVDEEAGQSTCRRLCQPDHTCSDAGETCVCTSDPRYQYCRPIQRFALTACFRDQALGIGTGICTAACDTAPAGSAREWCMCPSKMFGLKISCATDRGNATTFNPLCAPAPGDLSRWPTCTTDNDCQGRFAAP